eukprot:701387_1
MSKIKGPDTLHHGANIKTRLGYIEFGDQNEVDHRVNLYDAYNTGPVEPASIIQYYNDIRYYGCNPRDGEAPGNTDLYSAISRANKRLNDNKRTG